MTEKKAKYPEEHEGAWSSFEYRELRCTIIRVQKRHNCGYVRLPESPIDSYDGIMAYVPVHGGLTYAHRDDDGSVVFGFDCAHYNSEQFPINDEGWLKQECRDMVDGILAAIAVCKQYEEEPNDDKRATIAQAVVDASSQPKEIGFSGLLQLMGGKV